MTRPLTSSKLHLVSDPRPASGHAEGTPIRRYRLARLRLDSRPAGDRSGFEHLKRVYD